MTIDPKNYRPDFLKGAVLSSDNRTERLCRYCPTKLPSWVKYYCSFMCKEKAMMDKSYGHEEEIISKSPSL